MILYFDIGQLICLGSALHLKSKFGSGYRMTLVTESESKETQTVENYVKENLPQAVLAYVTIFILPRFLPRPSPLPSPGLPVTLTDVPATYRERILEFIQYLILTLLLAVLLLVLFTMKFLMKLLMLYHYF